LAPISVANALIYHDALQDKLFPIEYGLKGLPQISIDDEQIKQRILNGQKFSLFELNH
jgi:tRNA U55 pseudouridine synthase TruB